MYSVCLFSGVPLQLGVEEWGEGGAIVRLRDTHSVRLWLYVHLKGCAHSIVTVCDIIIVPAVQQQEVRPGSGEQHIAYLSGVMDAACVAQWRSGLSMISPVL